MKIIQTYKDGVTAIISMDDCLKTLEKAGKDVHASKLLLELGNVIETAEAKYMTLPSTDQNGELV
jgi:hypothetical protein